MNDKNMKSLSVKKVFMFMLVMSLIVTQALFWGANAASKKTPARVTISSVKAGGTNKVTVKWKKTKNANKYRVYYRKSGSKKWIKVVDTKKLSYTQKSSKARPLKANTKYQYVIKAYNTKSKKWGKLSKVKTIRTAKAAVKKTATPTQKPKSTKAPTSTPDSITTKQYQAQVVELSNEVRIKHNPNVSLLQEHTGLDKAALIIAKEYAENYNYCFVNSDIARNHLRIDRSSIVTAAWQCDIGDITGANIAGGQQTPAEAVSGWENSTGHLAAITDGTSKYIGVGVYKVPDSNYFVWIQLFAGSSINVKSTTTFDANGGTFSDGSTIKTLYLPIGFNETFERLIKCYNYNFQMPTRPEYTLSQHWKAYSLSGDYGGKATLVQAFDGTYIAQWQ